MILKPTTSADPTVNSWIPGSRGACFILLLILMFVVTDGALAEGMFRRSWPVMGTYAELEIDHDSPVLQKRGEQRVREVFRRVNRTMSTYSPESDLMKVNREGYHHPVTVDPWLADLLKKSQRLARLSQGAFSVDVLGYGVKLGLKPGDVSYRLPPAGDGYIEVQASPPRVRLKREGMGLDLGGIAKGYALDRAVEALRKQGLNRVFLSLGRGLYAGKAPRNKTGWPVRIQGESGVRNLQKQFVSVSEQGIRSDTGHIINPRTGEPIDRAGRVIVFAEKGWLADGASTAVFVDPAVRVKLLRNFPALRRVIID